MIGKTQLLWTQCRGIGPHLAARGKTHLFSQFAAGTCGIFSTNCRDVHLILGFVQRSQDSCLVRMDTSGMKTRLGRKIRMPRDVRWESKRPLLVDTVILGFLSIFTKSQASSPFEALNFVCLSSCQRDVRPPVQKRWRPRAFSRVFTGD